MGGWVGGSFSQVTTACIPYTPNPPTHPPTHPPIGVLVSVGEHLMTLGIDGLWKGRETLLLLLLPPPTSSTAQAWLRVGEGGWWPALFVFVGFGLGVTLLAVWVCALLDPTADCAGSGLPLLKYILSGEVMEEAEEHLKSRTLIAKALGLVLAAGAGLSIGREGPNIHIAAIISWLLMKNVSWFNEVTHPPTHPPSHLPTYGEHINPSLHLTTQPTTHPPTHPPRSFVSLRSGVRSSMPLLLWASPPPSLPP